MTRAWPWRQVLGVLVAIAITTAMDAGGLSVFSALPLFPLMGLFWFLERLPRRSVGMAWGRGRDYGLALLYPVAVIGTVAMLSAVAGAVDVSRTDWRKASINFALMGVTTFLVAIVTEEGFFRGWLWGSLERAGGGAAGIWIGTSIAFSLWHLSAVSLHTGFDLPAAQIPVFMVNAAVMGAGWGLLRLISGSVIVASASHGLWNGLAYVLFGYGTKVGALGIANTALFGPENGVLGLAVNALFVAALWRWSRNRARAAAAAGAGLQAVRSE